MEQQLCGPIHHYNLEFYLNSQGVMDEQKHLTYIPEIMNLLPFYLHPLQVLALHLVFVVTARSEKEWVIKLNAVVSTLNP